MLEGIVSLVTLLLKLLVSVFERSPEEKAEDRIKDRLNKRLKDTIEIHEAGKKFKKGNTTALERVITDMLRR